MLLVRKNRNRDPWHGYGLMDREVGRLFDSLMKGLDVTPMDDNGERAFNPRMDVSESEKEIRISAELPGMDEKDVEVTYEKDALTIRGEKKCEWEKKDKGCYHAERAYGAFNRTIELPEGTESDKIEAHFKNGVLTVTVPKPAKAVEEKKKIKIAS